MEQPKSSLNSQAEHASGGERENDTDPPDIISGRALSDALSLSAKKCALDMEMVRSRRICRSIQSFFQPTRTQLSFLAKIGRERTRHAFMHRGY